MVFIGQNGGKAVETVHIRISNGKNCTTCNKAKVCKYKESATRNVEKITEGLKQKELPLLVDISCMEWSGGNSNLPGLLR